MLPLISNESTESRLSGLERFFDSWLGPRKPEYGEPEANLATIAMPEPLRRFFAFAGRWPPVNLPYYPNRFCSQDGLCTISKSPHIKQLSVLDGRLVFVTECQGVWWAATETVGADPPVWLTETEFDRRLTAPTWIQLENPLSHFLVTFVLSDLLFSADGLFMSEDDTAMTVFGRANCSIIPLWINGEYAYRGYRHSFYLIDDCILVRHTPDLVPVVEYAFKNPHGKELLVRLGLPIENE